MSENPREQRPRAKDRAPRLTTGQARPGAGRSAARRCAAILLGIALGPLGGCGRSGVLAEPRGASYVLETASRPYGALAAVNEARLAGVDPTRALFDGPSDAFPVRGPVLFVGLPRGSGIALANGGGFIRDADLPVVESLVASLRRAGIDARLDRTGTLASVGLAGPAGSQRLLLHLDDIQISRGEKTARAGATLRVWARSGSGALAWERTFHLRDSQMTRPFDVLAGLGADAARQLQQAPLFAAAPAP